MHTSTPTYYTYYTPINQNPPTNNGSDYTPINQNPPTNNASLRRVPINIGTRRIVVDPNIYPWLLPIIPQTTPASPQQHVSHKNVPPKKDAKSTTPNSPNSPLDAKVDAQAKKILSTTNPNTPKSDRQKKRKIGAPETDPHRLNMRAKAILHGWVAAGGGFANNMRNGQGHNHPDLHVKTPKRLYDSMMSRWRVDLHRFDDPKPESESLTIPNTDEISVLLEDLKRELDCLLKEKWDKKNTGHSLDIEDLKYYQLYTKYREKIDFIIIENAITKAIQDPKTAEDAFEKTPSSSQKLQLEDNFLSNMTSPVERKLKY